MTMEEMNDMSLLEGAADNADLLEKLLKASLIHADETYQTPPQIICGQLDHSHAWQLQCLHRQGEEPKDVQRVRFGCCLAC